MNLEESRNNFLEEMAEQTGLSKNQIKRMLAQRDITRYDPEKKASYRATILADAEMYKRVEEKMHDSPKPENCPLPDCEGQKMKLRGRAEAWECSVGGKRHYWAMFVARATGNDPSEVLVTLNDMKKQQEKRDAITRKLYYEATKERSEKASS